MLIWTSGDTLTYAIPLGIKSSFRNVVPALLERVCNAFYYIYAASAFVHLSAGEVACIFSEAAPLPFIF